MAATDGGDFSRDIDLYGRLVRAANWSLDHWWLWIVLGAVTAMVLMVRAQHALIGELDERADAAFADVDALLVERHTLIGNLVEVVRAFARQERDVMREVLDARVDALEAVSGAGIRTEVQVAEVLQNLFSVSESYPKLASAGHYATLRTDLIRVEDRITAARRFYNLAVEELNGVRRAFPGNVIGRLFTRGAPAPERAKFSLGERRAEFAEAVKISL